MLNFRFRSGHFFSVALEEVFRKPTTDFGFFSFLFWSENYEFPTASVIYGKPLALVISYSGSFTTLVRLSRLNDDGKVADLVVLRNGL